ncbi:MAG: integration host factor subunit alpha [Nitrospirae bacterium CG18_big_fil_WC_8_21_14_2_50_70_55]|nr:integration host factor subunit alpha [Deltaproteobacteria bacterium]OIP63512.1 MAG: integration host factor subunit alpha [Nitrospirae bacterium CG2_30_70_394]PIQ07230.1 MAG: integration host factor subunit alpha [Nitrospirae bacterium CG18_big_fil_WC_8_21_14_2_50_70_55]PIU79123.1 MAG: integration host factor subunit alpha [Nitrospirae bacterium CG06_land_8_20_14_3_00_70_43]PIW83327.1 MAG: integration host factor subunit alpha [Nitrospirae bacterium CG_4_8_14_3_um_filter_70_85]PIX83404.1 M
MTKADLVEQVYERIGFSKKEAAFAVETVLESIRSALIDGQTVKIVGFGNFVVRHKEARKGRNPKSGEEVTITPRQVVNFKPSQVLKDAVQGGTVGAPGGE